MDSCQSSLNQKSKTTNQKPVKAIFFDAVGTLIHPEPSAIEVYEEAGRCFGSQLSRDAIAANFRRSFRQQDEIDRERGFVTDEQREVQRWRSIVAECLADVRNMDEAFSHLFSHFARPSSWRLQSEAGLLLKELAGRGYVLGIASNFDARLRTVLSCFPEMSLINQLVISSEVGWRKPAPAFFTAVCQSVGLTAAQVLYVGDDLENDYRGARAAGLHAMLFAPGVEASVNCDSIQGLGVLLIE